MLLLFTDYGAADIYAGQVKAVLHDLAPGVPVVDLSHDAPAFNIKASAHLLAALSTHLPKHAVTLAVVDPGVGSARGAVVVKADHHIFVGPDNGLLSVVAARAAACSYWNIIWQPEMSVSFHGRDLFAPVAARLARGPLPTSQLAEMPHLSVEFGAADLSEIIYIDHYGNALTGLRAEGLSTETTIVVGGKRLRHHRVFSEAPKGEVFWYQNSVGMVELAANSAHAVDMLGLSIGQEVGIAI